ncbi:MAG: hypothetical protein KJ958_06570 [Gammaproteobacteria bacterium]|nr:hypothetical protein [Gammaproteobacteria bacterium]MBU1978820.1 hypothetical protein [Gammaproteobacteria bacterium]
MNNSAEQMKPGDQHGWVSGFQVTLSSYFWAQPPKSLPLGGYCRNRPLVSRLAPRGDP